MTYRFLYKCRRCGEIDDSLSLQDGHKAFTGILMAASHQHDKGVDAPRMMAIHTCNDRNIGVTDLIGMEKRP